MDSSYFFFGKLRFGGGGRNVNRLFKNNIVSDMGGVSVYRFVILGDISRFFEI